MSRDIEIDVAKSLGIGMIVFGHLSGYGMGFEWLTKFFYVFHVPMFFVLSGLFINPESSFLKAVKSKVKKIYLPFLVSNFLCLLLFMDKEPCGPIPITLLKIVVGQYVVSKVGPTWFLFVLFVSSVLYSLISKICKGNLFPVTVISVCLLILGAKMKPFYYVGQILVAVFFLNLGVLLTKCDLKRRLCQLPSFTRLFIFLVSIVVVAILSKTNPIEIWLSHYGELFLLCVGVLAGTAATMVVSHELVKMVFVRDVLSFIGRNTLCILIMHIIVIQGVFFVHELMLKYSIPMCNAPMWIWYSLCFVLSLFLPAFLQHLVSKVIYQTNSLVSGK